MLDLETPAWHAKASCNDNNGTLNELFYSTELDDVIRAKSICSTCSCISQCLEAALTRREPGGIWGGQLIKSGRVVSVRGRPGRPPIIPRSEDAVPEIPIPVHLMDMAFR